MKKIILMIALTTISFVQTSFAQTDSKQVLNEMLTSYLNLKNSLIVDNADSARAAARKIFNAIDNMPIEMLPANQHKIWIKYSDKLHYDAEHIKSPVDIDHQREHFIILSKNMYELMKALNFNISDLYYQFCPMANNGKGAYWLSETEKIGNPYFGKQMLTCGSTKETLKAKQQ